MVPKIIKGGNFVDERGTMSFVNDFNVRNAQRFYTITHKDTATIRAWQGHEFEQKYFFPLKGRFVIAWVKIDDFSNPTDHPPVSFTILDAQETALLHIPNGYANGLMALSPDAQIGVFSDFNLEESVKEKHRYNPQRWFDWEQDFDKFHSNIIY